MLLGCSLLTALIFAAVKTSPETTQVYNVLLGFMQGLPEALLDALTLQTPTFHTTNLVCDRTDLIALPAAFFAFWSGAMHGKAVR